MSRNSALESMRFPACLMLTGSGVLLVSLLPVLITHQFGEASRLVRDSALSLHLVLGICLAVFLSGSLSRYSDSRSGASLVLSKPISRDLYYFSVYTGLLAMEMIFSVCMTLATCMAVASASEPFVVHWRILVPLLAVTAGSFAAGGLLNFWKRWNFCSVTLCFLSIGLAVAAGCGAWSFLLPEEDLYIGCIQAGLLNSMALIVFLGLSVGIALAFGFPMAASVCCVCLFLGLLSDYFVQTGGSCTGGWWRSLLACCPNWQRFWVADWLKAGEGVPWRYIGMAAGYAGCYTLFVLLWCVRRFRRAELHG